MRLFPLLFVPGLFVALAGACGGTNGGSGVVGAGSICAQANACPAKCDPALGCVACVGDGDCGGATKFCEVGRCVACRTNADCGVGAPSCWPSDHACHASCAAAGAAGCGPLRPYCDSNTGACEGCRTSADCAKQAPLCNASTATCAQCASNSDCPASAPRCLPTGNCVQCLANSDCGGVTPVCQAELRTCIAGCTTDATCMAPFPRCDTMRGFCVPCLISADCAPTQKCQNEICVPN
jgi:hypothetical protein